MMTTVTTIVPLAILLFLKKHGHVESGDETQALLVTYAPVAEGTKAATTQGTRSVVFCCLRVVLHYFSGWRLATYH